MNETDATALRRFDDLPASANVRLPVVASLFSISRATVWRWCRNGQLPPPTRIGGVTLWNVGALRERLADKRGGNAIDDETPTTPPPARE
jgi:predicted DNA-binding transcriptional regulator AlpA